MNESNLRLFPGGNLVDQLINNIAILTTEAQKQFSETYAEYSWRADLGDPALFWFEREPPAMFAPSFVGSTSGQSNTWLWGWENINSFPQSVVDDAERLHELAESVTQMDSNADAAELLTANLPLGQEERRAMGLPEHNEYHYVYAAMAVSGIPAPVFYRAPTGNGSYAWFALHNPDEFSLPSATPITTVTAITDALNQGLLTNHRAALQTYAAQREGVELVDEGNTTVLKTPGGDVTITLDEQGRITGISASQSAASPAGRVAARDSTSKGRFSKFFGRRG